MTHRVVEVLTATAVVLLGISRDAMPIALAALAAAVVLRLAGTTTRRLLSAVLLLLGIAAVFIAITARPGNVPALDTVDETTGIAPWLAAGGGVLLATAGVLGLVTAARWRRPTSRYERDRPVTSQDQWKAIDAGEDPTT